MRQDGDTRCPKILSSQGKGTSDRRFAGIERAKIGLGGRRAGVKDDPPHALSGLPRASKKHLEHLQTLVPGSMFWLAPDRQLWGAGAAGNESLCPRGPVQLARIP